jgi:hypothetical protein
MQRKIKFKFYDKQRKRLMDVISINWEQGILECLFGGQSWISFIENGELLQYIDRKDKYKKEIYEGNIIVEHDHLGPKAPMEVYWDENVNGFRCRRGVYKGLLPESKNIEVIGNRYDNPELLISESL